MTQPDKLKVEATIPRIDSEDIQLLHIAQFKPSKLVDVRDGRPLPTQEVMLHELGVRELGGIALSINRQTRRRDVTDTFNGITVNVSEVLTDPLNHHDIAIPANYDWYDTTEIIDELGNKVARGWVDADGNPKNR